MLSPEVLLALLDGRLQWGAPWIILIQLAELPTLQPQPITSAP